MPCSGTRQVGPLIVMPGLVPGIQSGWARPGVVDGRDKPGHDGKEDAGIRFQRWKPRRPGYSAARCFSRVSSAAQRLRRTSMRACLLQLPGTRVQGASPVLVLAIMSLAASS